MGCCVSENRKKGDKNGKEPVKGPSYKPLPPKQTAKPPQTIKPPSIIKPMTPEKPQTTVNPASTIQVPPQQNPLLRSPSNKSPRLQGLRPPSLQVPGLNLSNVKLQQPSVIVQPLVIAPVSPMILNPPRTYYKEAVINTLHVKPDLINKRKPIGENVVEVANVMIRSEESERSRVIQCRE